MKSISYIILIFLLVLSSCKKKEDVFTLSFGSCNNQRIANNLWEPLLSHEPDLFVWGGDIIYSDTDDMQLMQENYELMRKDTAYDAFTRKITVMGTWDDHDYGLNDGGIHYPKKDSVQQLLLDFLDVPKKHPRRQQKGVYHSNDYAVNGSIIKVIVLDTRYFRSDLKKDSTGVKRYVPDDNPSKTMLGETQWLWLKNTLNESKAQFNVIVSSIQFLSFEHGYETWGNMPHEVEKMKRIIVESGANGVLFLSGDRHIAEISSTEVSGLDYPLVDFTSSGMTHSYSSFSGEPNEFRIGEVIPDKNFGLLVFDFNQNTVKMQIRGEKDILFQEFIQKY